MPLDIPLLVFTHGLGGSAAQFAPLLTSLVNSAPCLAIDLPGCGLSDFKPSEIEAYTLPAFAELLYCAIDRFRNKDIDQKVILIGHSMGCSISALLASSSSPLANLCSSHILGMIALCPRSSPLSAHDLTSLRRLNWIPSPLFNLIRLADRRGGLDSASVLRMVGKNADRETRKLQLRYNQQSKTSVFQKIGYAIHVLETTTANKGQESLLGRRVWAGMKMPLFLVAAENDRIAPPKEVEQIIAWLTEGQKFQNQDLGTLKSEKLGVFTKPLTHQTENIARNVTQHSSTSYGGEGEIASDATTSSNPGANEITSFPSTPQDGMLNKEKAGMAAIDEISQSSKHSFAIKTTIFPAPASHGLLYTTADIRIISGLIENFNGKYLDERLSHGWQLQHLTTSGKWDVKNLQKWQSVEPCSEPIAGVFRAMKTMREIDDTHCPVEFVKKYGYKNLADGVAMVVDISHESPVYDKSGLENGGVEYHKLPTVSKLPPTADEVEHFISLIDRLRQSPLFGQENHGRRPTVAVHCHYGYNRTGTLVICYLVERLNYKLQEALDEFAEKRPPGIKHQHFVNELFVRYSVKMERRGTLMT